MSSRGQWLWGEDVFTLLNKSDSHTSLSKDRLDSLLRISEGSSVDAWQARGAIKLWWSEKTRRQVGDARQLRRAPRKPGKEDPDVSGEQWLQ